MSDVRMLDGLTVEMQLYDASASNLGGRALMTGELGPTQPHPDGKVGLAGALSEMARAGWPVNALGELALWFGLSPSERASVSVRTEIEAGADKFDFKADPALLLPPYPIDLLHVPPATGAVPFVGPRGAREWLVELQRPPANLARAAFQLTEAEYRRETIDSLRNLGPYDTSPVHDRAGSEVRVDATLEPNVLRVRLYSPEVAATQRIAEPGSVIEYVVPLRSVRRIDLTASWSMIRPIRGEEKALYDARGYGPLSSLTTRVFFSDGWRLCTVKLFGKYLQGVNEPSQMLMVQELLRSVAEAQQAPVPSGGVPLPTPATERPRGLGLVDDQVVTTSFDFPDAVHFGVPFDAARLNQTATPGAAMPAPHRPAAPMTPPSPAPAAQQPPAPAMSRPPSSDAPPPVPLVANSKRTPPPPSATPKPGDDRITAGDVALAVGDGLVSFLWWAAPMLILGGIGLILLVSGSETTTNVFGQEETQFSQRAGIGFGLICYAGAVFFLRGTITDIVCSVQGVRKNSGVKSLNHLTDLKDSVVRAFFGLGCLLVGTISMFIA